MQTNTAGFGAYHVQAVRSGEEAIFTAYAELFEAMAPSISGWVPHPDEHERWVDLRVG
jgi:hypothetical protein